MIQFRPSEIDIARLVVVVVMVLSGSATGVDGRSRYSRRRSGRRCPTGPR